MGRASTGAGRAESLAAEAAADELKAHLKTYADRGIISKFASRHRLRRSLDKTSVGKLDKKCMREKYGAIEPVS